VRGRDGGLYVEGAVLVGRGEQIAALVNCRMAVWRALRISMAVRARPLQVLRNRVMMGSVVALVEEK
jgi:hypothetical protein